MKNRIYGAPPAPAAVAVPAASEVLDALNYVDDFVARCNGDDRGSCASVNLLRAALAAAPAQAVAVPLAWEPLPENADERRMFSDATSVYGGDVRVQLASMLSSFASAYPRGSFGAQLAIMANEVTKLHLAPAQEHATQLAGQGQEADYLQKREQTGATDEDLFAMHRAVVDAHDTTAQIVPAFARAVLARWGAAQQDQAHACQIPPLGWSCTRAAGHEGSCAAVEAPWEKDLVERGMQRLRDANAARAAAPAPAQEDAPQCAACFFEGSCEDQAVQTDAERYRRLREEHEGKAESLCVFGPNDMRECLVPIGSLPGELDAFIDAARAAQGGAA